MPVPGTKAEGGAVVVGAEVGAEVAALARGGPGVVSTGAGSPVAEGGGRRSM